MPITSKTFVRSTALLLLVGLLALMGIVGTTLWLVERTQVYFNEVVEAREARGAAVDLLKLLQDAETSQRGYVITLDQQYLDPYQEALPRIDETIARLENVLLPYPQAAEPMQQLREDIAFKLAEMSRTIDLIRGNNRAEAVELIRTDAGKEAMDRSRTFFDALINAADDRLNQGVEDQRNTASLLRIVSIIGALVIFAVIGGAIWAVLSYTQELANARRAVEDANAGLEERVRERTSDLGKANEEIQRFAYIVTHDLRAPLVNVMGFTAELETSVEKRIQRLARAMSEAKIARQQLQQAIDAIGEGFILYDSNDRIVLCNRKYRDFFPVLEDLLKPGSHFDEIVRAAAESGLVVEAVTDPEAWITSRKEYHRRKSCQFQQLLSDGRWVQFSERATNDGGKVTVVTDITHFRRLEETRRLTKVAEQSGLLATTVANIAQGVVVFDAELKLVAWNSQAAMLLNLPYAGMHSGMTLKELARQVWRYGAEVPKERRREAYEWIRNVRKRYPLRVELGYRGSRFVAANFRTMPDDSFVVTMTDISAQIKAAKLLEQSKEELEKRVDERTLELRRLNEILQDEVHRHEQTAADLERARKAAEDANLGKTRFLAAASHDLLQPLNAARLYLSALEASPLVDPGARSLLDNIAKAFQSTEALLSTLLDISKMDAGGYRPRLTPVKVGDLFETLEAEFGALARQKGLRLRRVDCSAVVRSDAQLLRRIVQNLLSNALKYTDSGAILLGARRRGDKLSIEIHDNGPGIAAENHQAIFEEFRRAAPAGTQTSGLGLGLAIVKRAADLLGHQVGLQSHVGRGSCFYLTVPLLPDGQGADSAEAFHEPPRSAAALAPANAVPLSDGPLFVLENDKGVADAMTTLFDYWSLASITAPSYPALLEVMQHHPVMPRAIIADLHLDGGIDGIDAIILLRERLGQAVPGILVTADQSREIKERAKSKGIEYFSKPMKPAQLRAYLAHLSMATSPASSPEVAPED